MTSFLRVADDFGLHGDIDSGILHCAEQGALDAVSVCAIKRFDSWGFVHQLLGHNVQIGAHITLVGETWYSGAHYDSWLSLIKPLLRHPIRFSAACLEEIQQQLAAFRQNNIPLSHIDSHQHVHVLPLLWPLFKMVQKKYNIPRIRTPYSPHFLGIKKSVPGFFLHVLALFRALFEPTRLPCIGIAHTGTNSPIRLDREKCGLKRAEVIFHPGFNTQQLDCYQDWGFDWDLERESCLRFSNAPTKQITFLTQLFYPEMISTGQTLTELAETLSAQGVCVSVRSAPPTLVDRQSGYARNQVYRSIFIRRVWSTRFNKLSTGGKLLNHLTFSFSLLFDLFFHPPKGPILVVTNPPFLGIIAAFYRLFHPKTSFLYLIFDVYPETAIRCGMLSKHHPISVLWHRLNAFVFRQATSIIVIGRCMQKIIKEKLNQKNKEKITLIPVWSHDALIQESSTPSFRTEWGLEHKFIVLYSGNMGRFHDMDTIIKAAEQLKDHPDIHFLFVGEGYAKKATQDYSKEKQLDNCSFHTYVPQDRLGDLLHSADVGLVSLLPSQVGLSVPSKTFGLLAAGVPVIGVMPPDSEIALILHEEKAGIIVTPGQVKQLQDAILTLYKNPQLQTELGQNGQSCIAQKYALKQAAKKYANLLSYVTIFSISLW